MCSGTYCAPQRVRQLQCYVVNNAAVHAGIYVSYLLVMSGTACLMIKEPKVLQVCSCKYNLYIFILLILIDLNF